LEQVLPGLAQAQEGRRVEDLDDQAGAEQRADEGPPAAEQAGAAQDDGGDAAERVAGALRRVSGAELGQQHDRAQEREGGCGHEGEQHGAVDPHAEATRRVLVGADGPDAQSPVRAAQGDLEEESEADQDDEHGRDRPERVGDGIRDVAVDDAAGSVPQQVGEAAQRDVRRQRGGDGGEVGVPDHGSVDRSGGHRCREHQQQPGTDGGGGSAVVDEEGPDDDQEARQRSDGQVDAADEQRHGLPQGDEPQRCDEQHHGVDVVRGQVAVVLAVDVGAEGEHDREQDDHGRVVTLQEAAHPVTAALAQRSLLRDLLRCMVVAGGPDRGVDHPFLGHLGPVQGRDHPAAGHDEDAVAQPLQLLGVAGGDDDGNAGVRDVTQQRVDLGPRPDVDALRRLVGQDEPRLRQQGPGQHDLLLVATREGGDTRLHRRGLDAQIGELVSDQAVLPPPAQERSPLEPGQRRHRRVLPDRQRHHQAFAVPVGRQVGRVAEQLLRGLGASGDGHLAAEPVEPRERAQQLA
jgi:hypothetical protein